MTRIPTISCTYKGKRCIAIDKKRNKWMHDAQSEAEAELLSEAVADRGWIPEQYWRKQ